MAEQKNMNNEEVDMQDVNTESPKRDETDTQESVKEDAVEAVEETEDSSEEVEEIEEDKKVFKKKIKTDKKQEAMKNKVNELEDKVKRQMAEFENYRKRTEKEKTAMFEVGAKSVIEKILPIVDNFERGLASIPEEEKGTGFAEGMQMVYKQLMTELESLEVKPIEAMGLEFNPDYHNAVMQIESDEYESGIIAQELQKGYTYRDTVIRYSMVTVVS